jgi:hypothetical protein
MEGIVNERAILSPSHFYSPFTWYLNFMTASSRSKVGQYATALSLSCMHLAPLTHHHTNTTRHSPCHHQTAWYVKRKLDRSCYIWRSGDELRLHWITSQPPSPSPLLDQVLHRLPILISNASTTVGCRVAYIFIFSSDQHLILSLRYVISGLNRDFFSHLCQLHYQQQPYYHLAPPPNYNKHEEIIRLLLCTYNI